MAISVRLKRSQEQAIHRAAKEAGISKSEFIRNCLADYLAQQANPPSLWERGKDIFGQYASGRTDVSQNAKTRVKEIIRAKATRHRRRSAGGAARRDR